MILILPIILFARGPFDTPAPKSFNLSMFNTKISDLNKQVINNPKIRCRYVCDKKVYKEQKIAEAISFYKNSKI